MSIYNPPSKTQGIFNPSNFGGLNADKQITTDYLDANYIQFPVSQGNATLVGTSVLGNITQQGDFSTTGDLLVNDVNIITEIGTKQDTIEDGDLTIAKTDGLQSELTTLDTDVTAINTNNLIYNSDEYGIKTVSKWESRTIPEEGTWRKIVYSPELNLFVSIRLATENSIMTSTNGIVWESVINDLGGCRDIVWAGGEVGRFVIAHFALPGFSTSTDGKNWISTDFQVASGNICITYSPDLNIFVSVDNTGGVVKSIDDGLTWASITSPNENFPKSIVWSSELNIFVIVYRTGAERVAYSSNGDDWFNVIVSLNEWNDIAWSPQLELFVAVADTGDNRVMTSTDGINWIDGTIPLYLWESVEWSELGFFIATAKDGYILYSSDGFNWADSELTGSLYGGCWSKELGIFVIVGNDTIYTSSLKNRKPTNENIFNNEFNSIDEDGTWTFNALNTNSITLPTIGDVEPAIQGKQDAIEDGDLTIANTSGLQTALNDKQDEITTDTDLTLNSITTEDLIVNNLNVDNVITYEANEFNTIVIRRFDESTSPDINLSEFQIWVNNENIIYENRDVLDGYFANWSNKDTPIPSDTLVGFTNSVNPYLFNNVIEGSVAASGSSPINAVIIKNIPLTSVNDIQAIVLYHRSGDGNVGRAIGLTIELYNLQDDPNLLSPLATTPIIERGVRRYRYNFPSINTYTLGTSDDDSISQIPLDNEDPTTTNTTITEEATITNAEVNINTDTTISGDLVVDTITLPIIGDVKTSIQGNTDNILTNTNNLTSVQTQVDALINFTGGGVNFRAYSLSGVTINAGNNLTYDNEDYDTENSYDTSNNVYTIVIGGTYVFSFGWYVVSGSTAVINLIRKRNSVETILQQSTNGTNTANNSGFFSTTIAECETDDEVYAYLDSGSCRLIPYGISDPDTLTSFSGSRISN